MPMMSNSGWTGDPWHHCDRCGEQYHVSALSKQRGLILCSDCRDNPIAWQRESVIREVLSNNQPEPALADILKAESSDDDTGSFFP